MFNKQQRGFTLIELVVVIVILGILAAFAVPRFMGMEGEARAATVRSFGGALKAAATMARAKCQAQDCGLSGTVTIDGVAVTMVNGYPSANNIASTVDLTTAGFGAGVGQGAAPFTAMRFVKTGGATATCWVQYNNSTGINTPPAITYGAAGAALVTGCSG